MGNFVGKQTISFSKDISIEGYYSIVGDKEGFGNFKNYFSKVCKDDFLGEKTYEHAERKFIELAVRGALNKCEKSISDIDALFGGDLLNQIISSSFAAGKINANFLGVYGACSTMAESLLLGCMGIESGCLRCVGCFTGSHFSSAERQYRFPLELGNQRPPVSQWTVTGAGCSILGEGKSKIKIKNATIGKVVDFGVKDINNMGCCMAPAAAKTLIAHFEDTKTKPSDYDLIITGDLGKLGSDVLREIMAYNGYKLGRNYGDCGQMIYNNSQKTFQGGSGTGCCAVILNSYIFKKMEEGDYKKVLFAATGALLSTTSFQQGDSIPCICHAIEFERGV